MWKQELSSTLAAEFKSLQRKNPRFSLRAYAKKLGVSPGSLSDILSGKSHWKIRPKRVSEILFRLDISDAKRNRLLVQIGEPPHHSRRKLPSDQYSLLSSWDYFPVLFSFDLPMKKCTPDQIALRLGISEQRVELIASDLLKRGHLTTSNDGRLKRREGIIETSDGIPSSCLMKIHLNNLELSRRALSEVPMPKRDVTSFTFAGSQKKLDLLRAEIRALYERSSALMDGEDENDNVFMISIQAFPVDFAP